MLAAPYTCTGRLNWPVIALLGGVACVPFVVANTQPETTMNAARETTVNNARLGYTYDGDLSVLKSEITAKTLRSHDVDKGDSFSGCGRYYCSRLTLTKVPTAGECGAALYEMKDVSQRLPPKPADASHGGNGISVSVCLETIPAAGVQIPTRTATTGYSGSINNGRSPIQNFSYPSIEKAVGLHL